MEPFLLDIQNIMRMEIEYMRRNEAIEALFANHPVPQTPPIDPLTVYHYTKKKKGGSLSDFYREVYDAQRLNAEHPYQNKNANEIEFAMMRNRKLIETARSRQR